MNVETSLNENLPIGQVEKKKKIIKKSNYFIPSLLIFFSSENRPNFHLWLGSLAVAIGATNLSTPTTFLSTVSRSFCCHGPTRAKFVDKRRRNPESITGVTSNSEILVISSRNLPDPLDEIQ